MKARGFTLLELAIVMSIVAILIPLLWLSGRTLEAEHRDALADATAAREMRALSEELRRDLRTLRWQGSTGLVLEGTGSCAHVEYVLTGEVLERRALESCGGTRVVAAQVQGIERTTRRLEVLFAHHAGRESEHATRFVAVLPGDEAL